MRLWIAVLITIAAGGDAMAAYADRELWLPVAGRTGSGSGRFFYTTIWITNPAAQTAEVQLSFFGSAQPGKPPRSITRRIGGKTTVAVEIDTDLATPAAPLGSLQLTSTVPIAAVGRIYGRAPAAPDYATIFDALPARAAVGTGQWTTIHGATPNARYRIYIAETHGFPLYFSLTLMDREGRRISNRRHYLGSYEQRGWDIAEQCSAIRIAGINGGGRVVAVGTEVNRVSEALTSYQMMLPGRPRHQMPIAEALAYAAAGLAIGVAAFLRKR